MRGSNTAFFKKGAARACVSRALTEKCIIFAGNNADCRDDGHRERWLLCAPGPVAMAVSSSQAVMIRWWWDHLKIRHVDILACYSGPERAYEYFAPQPLPLEIEKVLYALMRCLLVLCVACIIVWFCAHTLAYTQT